MLPDGKFTLDPHALPAETGEDPTEFYQAIDGADAAGYQDFISTGTGADCLFFAILITQILWTSFKS